MPKPVPDARKALVIVGGTLATVAVLMFALLPGRPSRPAEQRRAEIAEPRSAWRYAVNEDHIRGTRTSIARTPGIPLDGGGDGDGAVLEIWRSDHTAFWIKAERVMGCGISGKDIVAVRIDDGPLEYAQCHVWNDDSTYGVFIPFEMWQAPAGGPFPERFAKAQSVTIELPIWSSGRRQYRFDVAGLPDRYVAKPPPDAAS